MLHLCVFLLVLGIIFLLLEAWLPGVEFFAIAGIVALVISAVLAVLFVPGGWFIVAGQGAVIGGFVYFMVRYMRRKQLQGRLILSETLAEDVSDVVDLNRFLGKEGKTLTRLRPYGEADFNGICLEVSSSGPMIEVGTRVRVTEVQQNKLVVNVVDGN